MEMQKAREIVEKAHAIRKEKGIPVRQPLSRLAIYNTQFTNKNIIKLILEELNIKNVEFKAGKGEIKVVLDTKITKELEGEMKIREITRAIQEKRKEMGLNLTQRVNVYLDELPTDKKLVEWMMKKAQINKLEKGKFKMTKVE